MISGSLLAAVAGSRGLAPEISVPHELVSMAVALGVIVGGIWAASKLWGRMQRRGTPKRFSRLVRSQESVAVTVLGLHAVGKGKSVAIVEVGAQRFLVGISDSQLTPLGELRTDGVVEGAKASQHRAAPGVSSGHEGAGVAPEGGALAAGASMHARTLTELLSEGRDPRSGAAVRRGSLLRGPLERAREATVRR
ncbi:MAG: flagellar biosynthetic protein FliO [Actinomycetota bacterium]|jgi:flagellar biogenesis protein FliO|nr:flagellar biosynthetic protein FliO [Actinomycetota bacterium]